MSAKNTNSAAEAASNIPTVGLPNETPMTVVSAPAVKSEAVILTQKDSQVSDLVKGTGTVADLEGLTITELERYDPLSLPEECAALHKKKYRFRWLSVDKFLESKLKQGLWLLCTRANCPFIKAFRFKSHGGVEQAGMLLAFTTEKLAQWREQQPAKKSATLVKHYTEDIHKNEAEGFYKPESAGGDDEVGEFTMED